MDWVISQISKGLPVLEASLDTKAQRLRLALTPVSSSLTKTWLTQNWRSCRW